MTLAFENDTRKVIRRLARRSMQADRRRSLFIILTISLAVCLMGMLGFIQSARKIQTREDIQGHYQAGCIGTLEEIRQLAAAGKFEKWGYTVDGPRIRYGDSNLSLAFVDPGMIDLMKSGQITGAYPQTDTELCIERAFLEHFQLPAEPGRTITLDLGQGESTYTIAGILEKENISREFTCWLSESAALALAGHTENPYELRFRFIQEQPGDVEQLRADINAFFREMGISEERTFFSSNYFEAMELYLGSDVEAYLLSAVIALICAVVIYNIFYISVMGKMREYGRLKVLGATPAQLRSVVKREQRLLTAVSIPPGLIAAAVITLILMPGYWAWADNLRFAAVISVLTYAMVLVAARKPLQLAGRVSAIEAIRTTVYSQQQECRIPRHNPRPLTLPRLARMNFSRSRKKAFVTSLSLSLTGILLLCVSAYADSIDADDMALSQFGDHSAYLLDLGPHKDFSGPDVPKLQQENPLGRALQEKLSALPGIDYITTYDQACVQIPEIWEGEPFHVTGFNEEQMTALFTEDMILDGFVDHRRLLHENGILVSPGGSTLKTVYHTEYQPGDTVTLESYSGQTKTYTVQGIVKHPQIGPSCFFILPTEELAVLYPEIDDFTTALNLHTKKDSEQLRQAVFDTVTSDNITISVLGDRTAEIKVSLQDEMRKYYGILIFVFLFSLINLANTLITNLLARQQEFGIFQSVGMSNRQLSAMLSYECLYYVGITLSATLTLGTVCSILICRSFDQLGLFGKVTYHFPVLQVTLFAAALLLVQAVFSICAVRYTRKLSLVERIKAVD